MRLGAYPCVLAPGSVAAEAYGATEISERHRHRYEFANEYREQLAAGGARPQRDVARQAARRDDRAARPPVLRRLPVPPRVQEPPGGAAPAVRPLRPRRPRAARGARATRRRGGQPHDRRERAGRPLTGSRSPYGRWAIATAVALLAAACLASLSCDSENACGVSCPTGSRFTDDGTCACRAFDAGYCGTLADCPDAYCPASTQPDACGGGQLWSTTICGCYPLPDGGLPKG